MSTSRKYTERQVQAIAVRELQNAIGYQGDEIEANRTDALNYYHGAPRGDEKEGLSKVQSLDVGDMVESVLSFMVPSITSQSLVQFASVGAEDEEQAAKESRIVQALVRSGQSNAYVAIQAAAKSALLLRNGILKVWVDVESMIERDTFQVPGGKDGPDELALAAVTTGLTTALDTEVQVVSYKRRPKAEGGAWDVTLKVTNYKRTLRMAAVDPSNFVFASDAAGMDVAAIRFVAEQQKLTRSDLVDEGFSEELVADLPMYGAETRNDINARRRYRTDEAAADFWQQTVQIHRCYMWLGTGEGGRAELWKINLAAQKTILSRERVRCAPYAVGAILFDGFTFQGVSLFDKLKETQDTKTGFLRSWLNNSQFVNRPRAALREGMVNEDDFYNVVVGGGIKVNGPGAIEWVVVPDIGPSCAAGLEYQDKMRAERGGASLDLQSGPAQLNSPTAAGTERELSVKEQLAALFASNLTQTLLRSAYLIAHKVIKYEMGPQVSANDGGEWLEDSPGQWQERGDVSVVIGLSPGERARRLNALQTVISQQEKVLGGGGENELTTKGQMYRAMIEWTRAAGLDSPEKYWMDPDSEEAQQARQEKEQRARQLGSAQAELMARVKILESQIDAYKVQVQEATKYYEAAMRAETELAKITGQATLTLEAAAVGATQRSDALMAASMETAAAASANAGQPAPEAGVLPAGTMQ